MERKTVHGYFVYRCEQCHKRFKMYCEKGIEEFGKNHKPAPFFIRCTCGGMASDISGLIKLNKETSLLDDMCYFANKENKDCGYPVLVDDTYDEQLQKLAKAIYCDDQPSIREVDNDTEVINPLEGFSTTQLKKELRRRKSGDVR